jgi:hypothetical protein
MVFGQKGCGDSNRVLTFSVSAAFESGLGQHGCSLFLALCSCAYLFVSAISASKLKTYPSS